MAMDFSQDSCSVVLQDVLRLDFGRSWSHARQSWKMWERGEQQDFNPIRCREGLLPPPSYSDPTVPGPQ